MVLTKVHRIGRVKKITEWKGSYPCSYETSGTRHHRKLTEKEITYEKATETLSHCGSGRRITVFSSAGSKRADKSRHCYAVRVPANDLFVADMRNKLDLSSERYRKYFLERMQVQMHTELCGVT